MSLLFDNKYDSFLAVISVSGSGYFLKAMYDIQKAIYEMR